ncbi:dual specificity protein phosphatase PHS1 isoform X2 [Tanacetum coccineum]
MANRTLSLTLTPNLKDDCKHSAIEHLKEIADIPAQTYWDIVYWDFGIIRVKRAHQTLEVIDNPFFPRTLTLTNCHDEKELYSFQDFCITTDLPLLNLMALVHFPIPSTPSDLNGCSGDKEGFGVVTDAGWMLHRARDLSLASKTYPPFEQVAEISLSERLGKTAMLNIESSSFSWETLFSLHQTEHSSSNEHPGDDTKALEARVIHNCSPEWLKIKEAAEKARETAVSEANEVGEMTCSKLQEALECLYLMKYILTTLHFTVFLFLILAFSVTQIVGFDRSGVGVQWN